MEGESPLRNRAFRALWVASIFSYAGSWIQDVGQSWLMVSMTKSPLLVSMLTTSFTIPCVALALPGGALADRWDRRRILIWSQAALAGAALFLALATWLGFVSPSVLLLESALLGIGTAATSPAWQSLVPELAGKRQMMEAITLNSIAFNIARATGPALGGIVLALWGPACAFFVNAFSFGAVVWVLVRYEEVRRASELPRNTPARESAIGSLVAPIKLVYTNDRLRTVFTAMGMMSFAASAVPSLLPVLAKHSLETSATGYGLMLGAMGAGAVLAGVILRRMRRAVGPRTLLAIWMAAFGASVLGVSISKSIALTIALILVTGMGWLATFSTLNALTQLASPLWIKSRVMALYNMVFFAIWSVGATVGGALANVVGERAVLALAAVLSILSGFVSSKLPLPEEEEAPVSSRMGLEGKRAA